MKEKYPQNFELEIDREALAEFKKAQLLINCSVALGGLSVITGLLVFTGISERELWSGWPMGLLVFVLCIVLSFAAAMALTGMFHLIYGRRMAEAYAKALEVKVEGPFLVIREGEKFTTDRKLHFRAIVDYTVVESSIMDRCGVKALRMTTASTSQQPIMVHGLKNCAKVRDQLAEIDAMREFG